MPTAVIQRDRQADIDLPGSPSSVAGLLRVLRALEDEVPEIVARYRALADDLAPGLGLTNSWAARAPAALSHRRRPRGIPPAARAAAALAAALAEYANLVPAAIESLRAIAAGPQAPNAAAAAPLYVPDYLTSTVIDAGTLAPSPPDRPVNWSEEHGRPDQGSSVPWWPAPAPFAAGQGIPLQDCTPKMTDWRGPTLLSYGQTMGALNRARADWGAAATAMAAARRPRSERDSITRQATRYRAWFAQFAVIADDVAAAWAAEIQSTRQQLAAILDDPTGGISTMPAITTSSSIVASVAAQIREKITAGQSGRIAADDSEVAFGWSTGLAATLISYVSNAQTGSRHLDVLRATDSGDPLVSVPEGGLKPNAVDFTTDTLDLKKYAGIATISTESANWVSNVEQAVAQVLVSRLLRGIEADLIAALTADGGLTSTGTDLAAATLDAIAQIAGAGGRAGVLAVSATDWVDLMSESGASGGYVNVSSPEAGPGAQWMGLATVIVPTLAAGSAFVLDPRAVVVYEAAGAPLFLVDLGSGLSNNNVRVAAETWCGPYVTSPGGVAKITVTATP